MDHEREVARRVAARQLAEAEESQWRWTCALVSLGACVLVFATLVSPVSSSNAYDGPLMETLLIAVPLGGAIGALLFGGLQAAGVGRRRWVAAFAVAPAVVAGYGLYLSPVHTAYSEGRDAFIRYTAKFPEGALGEPYVLGDVPRESGYVSVCARQVRTEDTVFCVDSAQRPSDSGTERFEVVGSYRFKEGGVDEYGGFDAFDCAGDAVVCLE